MTLLEQQGLFQKPSVICTFSEEVLLVNNSNETAAWSQKIKETIKTKLSELGLQLRAVNVSDIPAITTLLDTVYTAEHRHYRAYSLFETIQFGTASILLFNKNKEVVGVSLNAGYGDVAKSLFTSFTIILPAYNGFNLGADLSKYAALIGFEHGLKVKRNTANPNNIPALINLLNYVGCTIDGFHKDLYQKRLAQYTMTLPLTPMGLVNNSIDLKKVDTFIINSIEDKDYKIFNCTDFEQIESLYEHTNFKIVAILPKQWTGQPHQFLALPLDRINRI